MTFQRALVRRPGSSYLRCISSHPLKKTLSHIQALKQHSNYCEVLETLNLEIIQLTPNEKYPDSCFVEDNAVIHNDKAFITRMAAKSRRGEEIEIEEVLVDYLEVKRAVPPATIEGGDVIHLQDRLICGVTQRTNNVGIEQMKEWLNVEIDACVDPNIIHLKSYVTYLGNNTVLMTKAYMDHPVFNKFVALIVPKTESYAANSLTINDTVLIPKGFPKTLAMIRNANFDVIPIEMSEFQKCEGSLTCLSLLF